MIIRWVCEKCNKKWIYPIEKCIYCKGSISKQKGARIKVAGITKVFIPSPMHPVIPYNILLLEDEHGNRLPKKTMKEYKIGDLYIEQRARTKNAVSIVKVKYDIYEAVSESVSLANIKFSADDKILVKPSIITAAYPYQAATTNPEFLDALLRVLLEQGIKKDNIMVAEQALIGSDIMDAASKAGILEVCKRHEIRFADISKGPFEQVNSDGYSSKIFKEALGRKVINCPIMKTNFQLGISGAMENLSRLVDEDTQRRMYFDDIEITLPRLIESIPEVINIADATNAMQGQGPLALGEPAFMNLVLAGMDAAALDSIFCDISMLHKPIYVKSSADSKIEVVGNEIDALKYPIKPAVPDETAHPDIKVIDGKACPACLNIMNSLTSKLVGLRGNEITIAMGSMLSEADLKGKERLVVLGDCAIRKMQELKISSSAKIQEGIDEVEQLVLLKKLLTTEGTPKITPVDRVKSKMKKLLSRVVR